MSETIIDGETGFLAKPVCVSSLAEKIELALNLDENKRKNITKSAKKNVEKNFSHVKMCNDTFQLYKKCLNEHKIKYEIK